jgi:hypothetical protein
MADNPRRSDAPSSRPPEQSVSTPEFRQKLDALRAQMESTQADRAGTQENVEPVAGSTEKSADQSAETAKRLGELRTEGHGPQRHHDPTSEQLVARLGTPIIDPATGIPERTKHGFVKAKDHIDPMTGTTEDGIHPGELHTCGHFATKFDSGEDFVAADRYMRQRFAGRPVTQGSVPISEVLGPDAHQRMSGFYLDLANPGQAKRIDLEGGTIFAAYSKNTDGELRLRTIYVNPVPFKLDQTGGNYS